MSTQPTNEDSSSSVPVSLDPNSAASAGASPTALTEEMRAALVARAKQFELPGQRPLPPGEAIDHYTSGFAKTLCSAIFITGMEEDNAVANVGGFTAPFEHRHRVIARSVDRATESVSLTLDTGVVRTAYRHKSQGCVTDPLSGAGIAFRPSTVTPNTPDAATTQWPMGDVLPDVPRPTDVDMARVEAAVEHAMAPAGKTLGFLVTHRGRIIAEQYSADPADNADMHTPFESWSMGKSIAGTLMARLIHQGAYDLWQPAPIPQWQNDARSEIRIADLMRMSSGIRCVAEQDAEYVASMGYPDHLYCYVVEDAFHWAANLPQQWRPNSVGRYRNCDPVLVNYLIRLAVEARGDDYHAFPQRALFDPLGIARFTIETDPNGNFLTQGYDFGTSRDWARLANLYLADGVWEGERLLPEGYVQHCFETAPAWATDGRPIYGGGFLWKNLFPIEAEHAVFAGAGGQFAIMIPSQELAVVRHGKYSGVVPGTAGLRAALRELVAAVPTGA